MSVPYSRASPSIASQISIFRIFFLKEVDGVHTDADLLKEGASNKKREEVNLIEE